MHPNDVEVVRLYPREVGSVTEDITLVTGSPFELAVEGEVGSTLFGGGGIFTLEVIIRDFTDNSTIIYTNSLANNFGGAWASLKETFEFNVPANVIANRVNHILEAHAILSVGGVGAQNPPDISFVRSRLFTVHNP
jgi:hypothetical protein